MRRGLFAGLLIALLCLPTPTYAQRTTGTIIGNVTDESGAVLPGVSVTLSGAAAQGKPADVTGPTGAYRFPSLAPGTYTLTFALAGFATLLREDVSVPLGGTVEINVQLKVSAIAETVTVSGEQLVVDTTTAQVGTNFNRNWVENAPQRRFTFFDLINQAAGVSPSTSDSERSTAFGGNSTDNSYQLDGTDFTAPLTGAAWPWPNTDAIEEVEVLSLGASAEYGNVQGAVFNVVTRQGSNAFHGDGNFYFQHDNLTSRNTTDAQDDGLPYHRDSYVDTTWQVGGPIMKDKFWFFGSFQYQKDSDSPAGSDPAFPSKSLAKRVLGKLNYQFNAKHKLQFAYHDDYYDIPDPAQTALTATSTLVLEHGHNPSPNLTWTSVPTGKTVIEARYSGFYGKDHGDPLQAGEPRVKPRYYDLDTGQVTGGIYSFYDGDIWKTAVSGKISHLAENFLGGSHDVKLGVQYDYGGSNYVTGPNDYIYTYAGVPAYGYTQVPWHQGGTKTTWGFYADDTYRIGSRTTLTLGLRYDRSTARIPSYPVLDRLGNETGQSSPALDDLFTWNSFSPRLGVVLKLNKDGSTLLKGHYGRYYRGVITGEFDGVGPSVTGVYAFDGTYDENGNPSNAELVLDNSQLVMDPKFKDPYTDQFIVGYEQEIFHNFGIQANFIYKRGEGYGGWKDIRGVYEPGVYADDVGAGATGNSIGVLQLLSDPGDRLFQLTNPSEMFTRYKGLSIQGVKRMSDNWQLTASLVLSKSTGRLGSSLASPLTSQQGIPLSPVSGVEFGQDPNHYVNTDGRLIADRPVIGKVQFLYAFPHGFTAGVNYTHQTGRLWSRQVRVPLGLPSDSLLNLEANTGDRRVPDWDFVDVRVEKDFSLGRGVKIGGFMDVLNLTNSDASESVGSRLVDNESFGLPVSYIIPRRIMLGAKIKF